MNLTLSVVAGLLLILPGLAAIASWSIRATRSGATRPELPLTAVSVLLIALGVSLCAHLIGYGVIELVRGALLAGGAHLSEPGVVNTCIRALVAPHQTLQPVWDNPFATALHAAMAKDAELLPRDAFWLATIVMLETLVVMSTVSDEGFDLLVEDVDFSNQGWVFQHYVRPAQNGYRAIAHVITSTTHNGLGVGYRGTVVDLRQSEKGETLAISLLEPERFLYELRTAAPMSPSGRITRKPPVFRRSSIEYIGGVVSLDARFIANIVIQNVLADMVDDIVEVADAFDTDTAVEFADV